jgi:DNA-3-methyladenine glycosylase
LNYGIHYLVKVVTEAEARPAAVLIRAIAPIEGIDTMRRRRGRAVKGRRPRSGRELAVDDLGRGPGNVTMAMGITLVESEVDLLGERLFIEDRGDSVGPIEWSSRIGIRVGTDRLWRAYLRDHAAVSAMTRPSPPR